MARLLIAIIAIGWLLPGHAKNIFGRMVAVSDRHTIRVDYGGNVLFFADAHTAWRGFIGTAFHGQLTDINDRKRTEQHPGESLVGKRLGATKAVLRAVQSFRYRPKAAIHETRSVTT
jgi:hypothetical protein